jgi:hypothetical protein
VLGLPLAELGDILESDYVLGGALILGGLLIGSYGQAGKFPVVTAIGIACVCLGTLEQFTTVGGLSDEVSERILTTVAFIGVVLLGIFALGYGLRRQTTLAGISLAIGILVLAGAAVALLMAIFFIDGPLGSF